MALEQIILTIINSPWTYIILLTAVIIAYFWSRH
jgi:hypothetical protein